MLSRGSFLPGVPLRHTTLTRAHPAFHNMSSKKGNIFSALAKLKEPLEELKPPSPTKSAQAAAAAQATPQRVPTSKAEREDEAAKQQEEKTGKLTNPLVWVDLEMTGLDVENDTIIEIACILTDGDIKKVIEGPEIAIYQNSTVMGSMNAWCVEHHGKSGLIDRVNASTTSMQQAEEKVLSFVKQHVPEPNVAQLAGNSIHVDRMFLVKHMPEFMSHLHYRIVDVSSVKELARRWFPQEYRKAPRKVMAHTALSDIRESIAELQYYRSAIFKPQTNKGSKGKK